MDDSFLYVPLQSILINRAGPVDALDLFTASGKAVQFTPGEVALIIETNGGMAGWLRAPDASELP